MGAANDNGGIGAAWVFTHRGGHWTEVKKLVGGGGAGNSAASVALPADGSIVVISGSNDYQQPPAPSTLFSLAE
jgi:hypothetical protein